MLYFQELTTKKAAKYLNVSISYVNQLEKSAIKHLRQSPLLYALYIEFKAHESYISISRRYTDPEFFEVFDMYKKQMSHGIFLSFNELIDKLKAHNKKLKKNEAEEMVRDFVMSSR